MPNSNRQWRLVSYPEGMPSESDWEISDCPIPEPGDGEMLVRAIYLDVAPYMRARISPQKNYAAGVGPGDVMLGGAIGEVVHSNVPAYQTGDFVVSDLVLHGKTLPFYLLRWYVVSTPMLHPCPVGWILWA